MKTRLKDGTEPGFVLYETVMPHNIPGHKSLRMISGGSKIRNIRTGMAAKHGEKMGNSHVLYVGNW